STHYAMSGTSRKPEAGTSRINRMITLFERSVCNLTNDIRLFQSKNYHNDAALSRKSHNNDKLNASQQSAASGVDKSPSSSQIVTKDRPKDRVVQSKTTSNVTIQHTRPNNLVPPPHQFRQHDYFFMTNHMALVETCARRNNNPFDPNSPIEPIDHAKSTSTISSSSTLNRKSNGSCKTTTEAIQTKAIDYSPDARKNSNNHRATNDKAREIDEEESAFATYRSKRSAQINQHKITVGMNNPNNNNRSMENSANYAINSDSRYPITGITNTPMSSTVSALDLPHSSQIYQENYEPQYLSGLINLGANSGVNKVTAAFNQNGVLFTQPKNVAASNINRGSLAQKHHVDTSVANNQQQNKSRPINEQPIGQPKYLRSQTGETQGSQASNRNFETSIVTSKNNQVLDNTDAIQQETSTNKNHSNAEKQTYSNKLTQDSDGELKRRISEINKPQASTMQQVPNSSYDYRHAMPQQTLNYLTQSGPYYVNAPPKPRRYQYYTDAFTQNVSYQSAVQEPHVTNNLLGSNPVRNYDPALQYPSYGVPDKYQPYSKLMVPAEQNQLISKVGQSTYYQPYQPNFVNPMTGHSANPIPMVDKTSYYQMTNSTLSPNSISNQLREHTFASGKHMIANQAHIGNNRKFGDIQMAENIISSPHYGMFDESRDAHFNQTSHNNIVQSNASGFIDQQCDLNLHPPASNLHSHGSSIPAPQQFNNSNQLSWNQQRPLFAMPKSKSSLESRDVQRFVARKSEQNTVQAPNYRLNITRMDKTADNLEHKEISVPPRDTYLGPINYYNPRQEAPTYNVPGREVLRYNGSTLRVDNIHRPNLGGTFMDQNNIHIERERKMLFRNQPNQFASQHSLVHGLQFANCNYSRERSLALHKSRSIGHLAPSDGTLDSTSYQFDPTYQNLRMNDSVSVMRDISNIDHTRSMSRLDLARTPNERASIIYASDNEADYSRAANNARNKAPIAYFEPSIQQTNAISQDLRAIRAGMISNSSLSVPTNQSSLRRGQNELYVDYVGESQRIPAQPRVNGITSTPFIPNLCYKNRSTCENIYSNDPNNNSMGNSNQKKQNIEPYVSSGYNGLSHSNKSSNNSGRDDSYLADSQARIGVNSNDPHFIVDLTGPRILTTTRTTLSRASAMNNNDKQNNGVFNKVDQASANSRISLRSAKTRPVVALDDTELLLDTPAATDRKNMEKDSSSNENVESTHLRSVKDRIISYEMEFNDSLRVPQTKSSSTIIVVNQPPSGDENVNSSTQDPKTAVSGNSVERSSIDSSRTRNENQNGNIALKLDNNPAYKKFSSSPCSSDDVDGQELIESNFKDSNEKKNGILSNPLVSSTEKSCIGTEERSAPYYYSDLKSKEQQKALLDIEQRKSLSPPPQLLSRGQNKLNNSTRLVAKSAIPKSEPADKMKIPSSPQAENSADISNTTVADSESYLKGKSASLASTLTLTSDDGTIDKNRLFKDSAEVPPLKSSDLISSNHQANLDNVQCSNNRSSTGMLISPNEYRENDDSTPVYENVNKSSCKTPHQSHNLDASISADSMDSKKSVRSPIESLSSASSISLGSSPSTSTNYNEDDSGFCMSERENSADSSTSSSLKPCPPAVISGRRKSEICLDPAAKKVSKAPQRIGEVKENSKSNSAKPRAPAPKTPMAKNIPSGKTSATQKQSSLSSRHQNQVSNGQTKAAGILVKKSISTDVLDTRAAPVAVPKLKPKVVGVTGQFKSRAPHMLNDLTTNGQSQRVQTESSAIVGKYSKATKRLAPDPRKKPQQPSDNDFQANNEIKSDEDGTNLNERTNSYGGDSDDLEFLPPSKTGCYISSQFLASDYEPTSHESNDFDLKRFTGKALSNVSDIDIGSSDKTKKAACEIKASETNGKANWTESKSTTITECDEVI
ncbi:hypothetical protein GZH46_02020, partial [Fragariocoptes setiger]